MKAVRDTYRSITSEAPVLFESEKFKELNESRAAALSTYDDSLPGKPVSSDEVSRTMSDDEFRSLVASKITVEPNIRERANPVYLLPRDRYEALLSVIARKVKISATDLAFMAEFEKNMIDEQAAYFASVVSMNN